MPGNEPGPAMCRARAHPTLHYAAVRWERRPLKAHSQGFLAVTEMVTMASLPQGCWGFLKQPSVGGPDLQVLRPLGDSFFTRHLSKYEGVFCLYYIVLNYMSVIWLQKIVYVPSQVPWKEQDEFFYILKTVKSLSKETKINRKWKYFIIGRINIV